MKHNPKYHEIEYIRTELLFPHKDNPRSELGDLSELAESIKTNGIMQNLTVVENDDGKSFTVIIGHRRHAAAKLANLSTLPCAVVEMTKEEQLETMLTENMQRTDLTMIEQAKGMQMILDLGCDVKTISEKTGLSQTTVRRRLRLNTLDKTALKNVKQISIEELNILNDIDDDNEANKLLQYIGTSDFKWKAKTAISTIKNARQKPLLLEILKKYGGRVLEASESYSGDFKRIADFPLPMERIDEKDMLQIIPSEHRSKPLYWRFTFNDLMLYVRIKDTKINKPKKTPEEIKREKDIKEAWQDLESLEATAYECRRDFINTYRPKKEDIPTLMVRAAIAALHMRNNYKGLDLENLCEMFGIDDSIQSDLSYDKRSERLEVLRATVRAAVGKIKLSEYPKYIYLMYGDSKEISFSVSSQKDFPKRNAKTCDSIYDFLIALGYTPSKEEAMLLEGSHEIFHRGDAANK